MYTHIVYYIFYNDRYFKEEVTEHKISTWIGLITKMDSGTPAENIGWVR